MITTRRLSFPANVVFATALVSFIAFSCFSSAFAVEDISVVISSVTTRTLLQEGGEGGGGGGGGDGGGATQSTAPTELPTVSDTAPDVAGGFPGIDDVTSSPGGVL